MNQLVKLSYDRLKITIEGRIIKSTNDPGDELLEAIPTVSLGSVFRASKYDKAVLVDHVTVERDGVDDVSL